MSNLPYNQAAIPEAYRRHIVEYHRKEAPGTIVVDSDNRFLYYVLAEGQGDPLRHRGRRRGPGLERRRQSRPHGRMAGMGIRRRASRQRLGPVPDYVTGGPHNPMGARGMYLFSGNKDTLYRIHGTNQPEYIGQADFLRLHPHDQRGRDRPLQARQGRHAGVVLAPHQNDGVFGARMASAWGRARTEAYRARRAEIENGAAPPAPFSFCGIAFQTL